LTVGLNSCETIRGWFETEVDTTYDGEIYVVTDETELKSTDAYGFNATVNVQIINEDLYEYEDEIQNFRTSDVTFEILAVDSSGVLFCGR
jgi:hypothetical protein